MKGAAESYPRQAREAFEQAVFVEGQPYTRVVKLMRKGELQPSLPAYPRLSYSTARRWRDNHDRAVMEALPPDLGTWQKIANESLKVLGRELEKLKRDSRGPRPVDPDRIRKLLAAIKDARTLVSQSANVDAAEDKPAASEPSGLAERLALAREPETPDNDGPEQLAAA